MRYNIIPALTMLVITIIWIFLAAKIREGSSQSSPVKKNKVIFKVSIWTYAITIFTTIFLVVLLMGTAYYMFPIKGAHPTNIGLVLLGLICFIVGMYGTYRYSKVYVLIEEGVLIYHDGRRIKINVNLKDIKSVRVFQMYIVIDVGEKLNKLIPIYFKNVTQLVFLLKSKY